MPYLTFPTKKDTATGLLAQQNGMLRAFFSSYVNQWVIVDGSTNFSPSIEIDGKTLQPCHITYLGETVWRNVDSGSGYQGIIFKSASGAWVYRPSESLPEEPSAYYDIVDEEWKGDAWWELSTLPTMTATTCSLAPKGTYINDPPTAPTCAMVWPRWQRLGQQVSTAPYGEYLARDGVSGRTMRHVGAQYYTSDARTVTWTTDPAHYRRLVSTDGRSLRPIGSLWVCGDRYGATTWWEGEDAPSPDEKTTYAAKKMVDGVAVDDPDTLDLELSFKEFGPLARKAKVAMAEVALWR